MRRAVSAARYELGDPSTDAGRETESASAEKRELRLMWAKFIAAVFAAPLYISQWLNDIFYSSAIPIP